MGRVLIVFGIYLREPVFLLKGSSILEFRCLAAATVDPDFPDIALLSSQGHTYMDGTDVQQFLAKQMMFIIFGFVLQSTQHVMHYAKKDVTACSYTTHHASFCQFLRHYSNWNRVQYSCIVTNFELPDYGRIRHEAAHGEKMANKEDEGVG